VPRARSDALLTSTGGTGLDPESPVPLHRQLRDVIVQSVVERAVLPGTLLPGEHALCHEFGVSRTVVRRSLAQLEADGFIERVKGKGTFVARRRTPERLAHTLMGLYEEAAARGSMVRSQVRRLEWVEPPPGVAEELGVDPCENVLVLERLRLVDTEPWSLSTTWLPARLGAVVAGADMTSQSLYQLLRDSGTWASSGTRSVDAAVATPAKAELLNVRPGDPLLVLHSLSLDQNDLPMEVFTAFHRGDRSRFEFHLRSGPPEPLANAGRDAITVEVSSIQPIPKRLARPFPTAGNGPREPSR